MRDVCKCGLVTRLVIHNFFNLVYPAIPDRLPVIES